MQVCGRSRARFSFRRYMIWSSCTLNKNTVYLLAASRRSASLLTKPPLSQLEKHVMCRWNMLSWGRHGFHELRFSVPEALLFNLHAYVIGCSSTGVVVYLYNQLLRENAKLRGSAPHTCSHITQLPTTNSQQCRIGALAGQWHNCVFIDAVWVVSTRSWFSQTRAQ